MRRLLAVLSLLLVMPAALGVVVTRGTGGVVTCTEQTTDNFNTGSFGTSWQAGRGADQTNCPWTIDSGDNNVLRQDVDHASLCDTTFFTAGNDVDLGGVDQYACITYVTNFGVQSDRPGVALRLASAAAATDYYDVWVQEGSTNAFWEAADFGDSIGDCNTGHTAAEGDVFCARLEGTGAEGTSVEVWFNPVGADPDDWGASDCCMNGDGSALRGTTCDDESGAGPGLDRAGALTSTGNYAGARTFMSGVDTSDFTEMDDWKAGTCS